MLGFGRDGGIGRRCGVGFFCGASSLFFLGALFSFGALLFQTFHFLLALLERDGHRASSQVRLTRVNNEDECELPAGFARLPRGFAIVLVGKSAAAMSPAAAPAAITTGPVPSPFVPLRCRQSLFMGSVSPRIFIERADQTGTCVMTEFAQGLRFNLADALASDVKSLTDFFESARITVLKTKTHADDALFARIQVLQHASDVFLEAEADGGVRGRGHAFIFNKVAEVGFFLFADWRLKR